MNQLFRYFLTFVATVAILLPSLGFVVVKHTCKTCDTVEFHLFDKGNCSACKMEETSENISSCCDAESSKGTCGVGHQNDSCCIFEITQPSVDAYIIPVKVSGGFHLEPAIMPLGLFGNIETEKSFSSTINYEDPPTNFLTGIDFLFFINQLKIPVS